jgi:hypothetical protein
MPVSTPNTCIALKTTEPAKDALVAVGAPISGPDTVSIWAQANVNPGLTQTIVGGFRKLMDYYLSELASNPSIQTVSMLPGGGNADIVVDRAGVSIANNYLVLGFGTPLDEEGTAFTHGAEAAFKRLIGAWLEQN